MTQLVIAFLFLIRIDFSLFASILFLLMSAILSADDLNDFITPGAACIKPPTEPQTSNEVEVGIAKDGTAYEVSKDGTSNLSPAQISLADCLACSGCITSAEEILVAQHSHEELIKALKNPGEKRFVASISHQSRASLATAFNLSVDNIDRLLINLFVNQMGFLAVIGTELGRKLSLISEAYNVISRKEATELGQIADGPILSSICPGWVLYAEKTHPYILPKMLDVKLAQQITGCLVKNLVADDLKIDKLNIYHLSVMPCFDKKLESARPEAGHEEESGDVDCVLTAKELVALIEQLEYELIPQNIDEILNSSVNTQDLYAQVAPKNWPFIDMAWSNDNGSASGGYSYNYVTILKHHLMIKHQLSEEDFEIKSVFGKNSDIYELRLYCRGQQVGSAAVVNGFRNIQNLVRKFKPNAKPKTNPLVSRRRARREEKPVEETADASKCDYVEIMACPSGCINGGGQISNPAEVSNKDWLIRALKNYQTIKVVGDIDVIPDIINWSEAFSKEFKVSEKRLLRTWFKEVEQPTDPNAILLGAKW